jgi:dehydrogenase/reductase SDR family protein 12
MTWAMFKKIARFYARFMPSFTAIGYHARLLALRPIKASFAGQTWVVTGGSDGLGRAIALEAARRGATVHIAARSPAKLEAVVRAAPRDGAIVGHPVDLMMQGETENLADRLIAGAKVDVLVNNVGALIGKWGLTPEGHEKSFALSLLNQYVLTEKLLKADAFAPNATIIMMASGGMFNAPLSLKMNPKTGDGFNGTYAYAMHKRGQAELVKYWQEKHGARGLRFYVMHPGWADTTGVKTSMPRFRKILRFFLRTEAQGGDTAIWLAATRPTHAGPEAFWFDRAPRDAHAYDFTRTSKHSTADLVAFLDAASAATIRAY